MDAKHVIWTSIREYQRTDEFVSASSVRATVEISLGDSESNGTIRFKSYRVATINPIIRTKSRRSNMHLQKDEGNFIFERKKNFFSPILLLPKQQSQLLLQGHLWYHKVFF